MCVCVKAKILRKGKASNPLLCHLMKHEQSSFVQGHLFHTVIYSSATISLNGIFFGRMRVLLYILVIRNPIQNSCWTVTTRGTLRSVFWIWPWNRFVVLSEQHLISLEPNFSHLRGRGLISCRIRPYQELLMCSAKLKCLQLRGCMERNLFSGTSTPSFITSPPLITHHPMAHCEKQKRKATGCDSC